MQTVNFGAVAVFFSLLVFLNTQTGNACPGGPAGSKCRSEVSKCPNGPDGSKCRADAQNLVSNDVKCLTAVFEQTGKRSVKLSNGETVSLIDGSGYLAVYDSANRSQYVYNSNGRRITISDEGNCTDATNSPQRSYNDVVKDVIETSLTKVRMTANTKCMGGPEGAKCAGERTAVPGKTDKISSACADFLPEKRGGAEKSRSRAIQ